MCDGSAPTSLASYNHSGPLAYQTPVASAFAPFNMDASVNFRKPHLGLAAAGLKLYDMRLASNPNTRCLGPGSIMHGREGSLQRSLRITCVWVFPTAGDAYAYFAARNEQERLFASAWCSVGGNPVTTPSQADDYYYGMYKRSSWNTGQRAVRVFGVEPVDALAPLAPYLVDQADALVAAYRAAPPPPPLDRPPPRLSFTQAPPRQPPPKPRGSFPLLCPINPLPPVPELTRNRPVDRSLDTSIPYARLTGHAASAVAAVQADAADDPALVERITAHARRLARSRGSGVVTARDVRDAASFAAGSTLDRSPADVEPENIDEVVDRLAQLSAAVATLVGEGCRRPRVLIIGERHAVTARLFRDAGADVATCDLLPSEDADIPHFLGDASLIQDRGWDLVIGHPPCTYLAQAGLSWLYTDPSRWTQVVANASVFRRMWAADAPFVALENSKMHRHGKALVGGMSPDQYVHPWQHGTGHTKPTALYLKNLPSINPTCVVAGREHAMARLPPSEDRSALRSRTYKGIAAAMATQWMPVLVDYVRRCSPLGPDAATMIAQATQEPLPQARAAVAITRRRGHVREILSEVHGTSRLLPSVSADSDTDTPLALRRWLKHNVLLPNAWKHALVNAANACPEGHLTLHDSGEKPRLTHLWVVDVTQLHPAHGVSRVAPSKDQLDQPFQWVPLANLDDDGAVTPGRIFAIPDAALSPSFGSHPQSPASPGMVAVVTAAAAEATKDVERIPEDHDLSTAARPWQRSYPYAPPPTPRPRHIRRIHGRWRVWGTVQSDQESNPEYDWKPLDPDLSAYLDVTTAKTSANATRTPLSVILEEQGRTLGDHFVKAQPPLPSQECPVCYDLTTETLACGHALCPPCQQHWLPTHGTCPVCRDVEERVLSGEPSSSYDEVHRDLEKERVRRDALAVLTHSHALLQADPNHHSHATPGNASRASPPARCDHDLHHEQHCAAASLVYAQERHRFLASDITRLWGLRPPRPGTYPGLGSDGSEKAHPSMNGMPPSRRVEAVRYEHSRWRKAGDPDSADANPQLDPEAYYAAWVSTVPNGAPPPGLQSIRPPAVAAVTFAETDLRLTPSVGTSLVNSLYVRNFTVLRRVKQETRKGVRKGELATYLVTKVLACHGRSLPDSGAAPSILTTGMLAEMPAECVTYYPNEQHTPLDAAGGTPLILKGTARLRFAMDGVPCSHDFTVVEGKPLILLGNDFLSPRRASITYDGEGDGTMTLHSITSKGVECTDVVRVSNRPYNQTETVSAVLDDAAAFVASVMPMDDTTGSSTSPEHTPASNPSSSKDLKAAGEPSTSFDTANTSAADDETACSAADLPTADTEAARLAIDALDGQSRAWKLTSSEHLLYSHRSVRLRKRAITTIRVKAPHALLDKAVTCLVDRLPVRLGLEQPPHVIPRCAAIDSDGFIEIEIINTSRSDHTLAAQIPLALLDSEYFVRGSVDPEAVEQAQQGKPTDYLSKLTLEEMAIVDAVTIDPDQRLSTDQRQLVRQLVAKHVAAFALDPKNPSKTHLMEVELPLKPDATPHRHSASKLGEAGRTLVEKHVEEMESRGIIRKSNSAWGSRVVLVTKKDGSIRFCVDYRDLNSKLKYLDSPIPLANEAIDRLASGTGNQDSLFLSTLDLASGFWCLPIREEDKELTAFVTHRQKYEFNYLPFGIQSGPSYMCRLMDAALQGLAWETCMPYLDDVGVWSTAEGDTHAERESASFVQMMERLENVFERLKWAGLSMKASKCLLFATSAEYLGHVMSREGLKMDPKKIAAVKSIDTTTINDLHAVRSFLGLCSYYRKFIEKFSSIAAPLHDLTKDGVDVPLLSQTPESQTAMKGLIDAITSEPVLATPRFDRPFIVKTDAAITKGIGGVLSQRDDEGRERVIAYYGRRLNKHEMRYTVTEIELLAAVESIKHWRPYLWGRKFSLIIDHAALRWLHTMRDTMEGGPASRLMRWILKLQEYNFDVQHKPGVLHKDADGVSRLVMAVNAAITARKLQAEQRVISSRQAVIASYLNTGAPSLDIIKDEQARDPECAALRTFLARGHAPDPKDNRELNEAIRQAREVSTRVRGEYVRSMTVVDDTLYHLAQDGTPRIFVPSALRSPLLYAYHDQMGHPSGDRTCALVRQRYYWPGLFRDAHNHAKECHYCTLAKAPRARAREPLGPAVGRYPFDIVYADILDMAETHDYKKGSTGFRKLIVFADSLSRWVEAIPVHQDPSSEQILDAFMTHVVSRYGAPRKVVTDHGSNLASRLCQAVTDACGVDLSSGASEHHESVGVVERFHRTLTNMARATDEGGHHWVDHLPFLLMSHRATPHRITGLSPAMLLYGRELRLPAQLGDSATAPSGDHVLEPGVSASELDYATRLHYRLAYAWQAAYDATRESQGSVVADTVQKSSHSTIKYEVHDRVARKLYGSANKLQYFYAGPYRITEVLGNGRYKLKDLENNMVYEEFDASNLRPYRAKVDADELGEDEYIVDLLLKHRDRRGAREYFVKWRGYPRSQGTWEPRSELERRCAELVAAYEAAPNQQLPRRRIRLPAAVAAPAPDPLPGPPPPDDDDDPVPAPDAPPNGGAHAPAPEAPLSHLPTGARFERGKWYYGKSENTPRGVRLRFLPSSNFTAAELASEYFIQLRADVASVLYNDADVAAVFHACSIPSRRETQTWISSSGSDTASEAGAETPTEATPVDAWFGGLNVDDGTVTLVSSEACAPALRDVLTSISARYNAAESLEDITYDIMQRAVDAVMPHAPSSARQRVITRFAVYHTDDQMWSWKQGPDPSTLQSLEQAVRDAAALVGFT